MRNSTVIFTAALIFTAATLAVVSAARTNASDSNRSWETVRQISLPPTGLVQTPHNVVAFLDDRYGIMAGDWGETWYTVNGGADWTRGKGDDEVPGHRYGVDIYDRTHAWTCGHRGDIGYSDNGGVSWKRISKYGGAERESCRYLSFADSQTGWIASATLLGATDDSGVNWREIRLPSGIGVIAAISCIGKDTGFIFDADGKGTLWFTDDGGKKWTRHIVGLPYRCYPVLDIDTRSKTAMRFADRNHGVIVLNCVKQRVIALATDDGGRSFTHETLPVENGGLYISRDCSYLTICGFENVVTVMKRMQ
jgi:hypothetical protein